MVTTIMAAMKSPAVLEPLATKRKVARSGK